MNAIIELCFYSELYRTKQVLRDVLGFIHENLPYLSSEDKFDLKLIFNELLCNAVIHGNRSDASKRVYVKVEIKESTIFARITDEGVGFDYKRLLAKMDQADEGLEEEGGRGIRLVYSLTDSLCFGSQGNQIDFRKRVASNG